MSIYSVKANNEVIEFDPEEIRQLYQAGEYGEITRKFILVLTQLEHLQMIRVGDDYRKFINMLVKTLLEILTNEEFTIPRNLSMLLVSKNAVISNLVCISSFKTTDPWLEILLTQKKNVIKLLVLYSHRNRIQIDQKLFFDQNPQLASQWYAFNLASADAFVTSESYNNCRKLLSSIDERLVYNGVQSLSAYMRCSYVDPVNDRIYKQHLNRIIKPVFRDFRITNKPDNKSILVVTGRWSSNTAVYKSNYKLIEALADDYNLTLLDIKIPNRKEIDSSLFDRVITIEQKNNNLDLSEIRNNNFILAYFPDVGMVDISSYLGNLRICPIQVMGYGHPVSTFGSEIDYVIGGQQVENYEGVESDYSERLVLIPGIGVTPIVEVTTQEVHTEPVSSDKLTITCAWGVHKVNYPMIETLKEIARQATRKVRYQFLQTAIMTRCSYVAYKEEMFRAFGDIEIIIEANRPNPDYVGLLRKGDLAIDAYPFGGYNTIVDNLMLDKPIVTWQGNRTFNRAASACLQQLGLEELIATDRDSYIEKTLRLIGDESYRLQVAKKIAGLDILKSLEDASNPQYFRKAIDYLIASHNRLKNSKKPILIR